MPHWQLGVNRDSQIAFAVTARGRAHRDEVMSRRNIGRHGLFLRLGTARPFLLQNFGLRERGLLFCCGAQRAELAGREERAIILM
jgi:hypothetical protein